MENQFDINLYNDDFYAWHLKYARDYSIKTMDWYLDNYATSSVIDFGCGIASYLESAYNKGIANLVGIEIGLEHAKKYIPSHLHKSIFCEDCTNPIFIGEHDLALCFEVAEHIEPSGTKVFVENIVDATKKGGTILFSAAPLGQDGTGHINCHSKDFWIGLFSHFGVYYDKELTNFVSRNWRELDAPDYIYNNLIAFKK